LTSPLPLAYVCIGSNYLPRENIVSGLSLIGEYFPQVKASQTYKSTDILGLGADYWNLVVQFHCPVPTKELKEQLQDIELACGRNKADQLRGQVHLDLDILFIRKDNTLGGLNQIFAEQFELSGNEYVLPPLKDLIPDLNTAWVSGSECV
jgi:2-amino-4-hydroxy-6-hydroxymethyldihydropteridine diphosphokinase